MLENLELREEVLLLNHTLNEISKKSVVNFQNSNLIRQSAVCMIFRINPLLRNRVVFKGIPDNLSGPSKDRLVKLIEQSYNKVNDEKIEVNECLEVFFIKRATNEGDRHSGQVAFPGGKCDG